MTEQTPRHDPLMSHENERNGENIYRTGLSTKCTLIKLKTGVKNARTDTKAKFRPFVDALLMTKGMDEVNLLTHNDIAKETKL